MQLDGGEFAPRAGLSKVNPSALHSATACHQPFAYHATATPFKLWLLGHGLPGCATSGGFYVAHYDHEQSPIFSRAVYYDILTSQVVLGKFAGSMYVGTDDLLRRLTIPRVPWGVEPIAISGRSSDAYIHKFTGFQIKGLREHGSVFLILLDGGAGTSKIAMWNGITMYDGTQGTTADLTGLQIPTCATLWRDKAVVGFGAAAGHIRVREPGSTTPGTWTTYSLGGLAAVDMVSHKGLVYIASGSTDIFTFDGSTVSLARTIAGATIKSVDSYNGMLYAGYQTASAARVARYNGSVWEDTHKDLTLQTGPPNLSNARTVEALRAFRGQLYAFGNRDTGGARLWISPQLDTGATWTELVPNASNNGNALGLLAA